MADADQSPAVFGTRKQGDIYKKGETTMAKNVTMHTVEGAELAGIDGGGGLATFAGFHSCGSLVNPPHPTYHPKPVNPDPSSSPCNNGGDGCGGRSDDPRVSGNVYVF
jgi:hypothetical protein